jgi:hypothetical protein
MLSLVKTLAEIERNVKLVYGSLGFSQAPNPDRRANPSVPFIERDLPKRN